MTVIRVYAQGEDGAFPESLAELVEGKHCEPHQINYTRLDGRSQPFIYFANLDDMSPANEILLAAPEALKGQRVVIFCDGRGQFISESKFKTLTEGKVRAP